MSYDLATYDPDGDFDSWYTDATGERIRRRLDELGSKTVLEIGCATGRMTEQLVAGYAMRRRVLAMDLDDQMLRRAMARDLADVDWIQGDVLGLKAQGVFQVLPRPFEAIVCCSVLHEVESPTQILWKARELLAPRGVVFVTVPTAGSIHYDGRPMVGRRGERYGVRRLWGLDEWALKLGEGTGLEVAYAGEMVLKPYPNERMERLDAHVLAYLAAYRGSGGALGYFELEAV